MTDTAELGHYVYAVGDATALHGLHGLTGIDDMPVTCAVAGRLCGLTSAVDLHAFRAAQQAVEVSETSWLAGAVRAHERVALHALERASVLPMRFGTVYPGFEDVTAMLQRHQTALLAELQRLAGGTEWCVTVCPVDTVRDGSDDAVRDAPDDAVRDAPDDALQRVPDDALQRVPNAGADASEPVSGTAWLLSRQAALQSRERSAERLTDGVERLRTALSAHVRDLVVSQPASGGPRITRLWLLIDDASRVHAAVDELRTQPHDVRIELTGPWPAYHFVRTDALRDDTDALRDDTDALRDDSDALHGDTAARRDDTAESGAHR